MPDSPKVFISYSHDSDEHRRRVLDLADRLRDDGVEAWIDQYEESFVTDWQRWMNGQIEAADFVLLICTEIYRRRFEGKEAVGGKGADWEGRVLTQESYDRSPKPIVPVVFDPADEIHRPTGFRGGDYFVLKPELGFKIDDRDGYQLLFRKLTHQPLATAGPVGPPKVLPSRPRPDHHPSSPDVDSDDPLTRYRAWAEKHHAGLQMIGLDAGDVQVKLDKIYVPLRALSHGPLGGGDFLGLRGLGARQGDPDEIDVHQGLKSGEGHHLLIFGDPGSGKTTALKKLHQLCLEDPTTLGLHARTIPVFLRLRRLDRNLLREKGLAAAIDREVESVSGELRGMGTLLLEHQRLLLLCDGLDEIADRDARTDLFRHLGWLLEQPEATDIRAVVSCRRIALPHADDDPRMLFRSFEVRPLDNQRIHELVHLWFGEMAAGGKISQALASDRVTKLGRALRRPESSTRNILELVSNPLLLTLLCVVALRGDEIPENRKRFYQRCLGVLLDHWPRSKGRQGPTDAESATRLLSRLAFRLHSAGRRDDLIWAETVALFADNLGDGDTADLFFDWCLDDAGVLLATGEQEYGFVHLGIQEFLTAQHLADHPKGFEVLDGSPDLDWWKEVFLHVSALSPRKGFLHLTRRLLTSTDVLDRGAGLLADCLKEAEHPDPEAFLEALTDHDTGRQKAVLRVLRQADFLPAEVIEKAKELAASSTGSLKAAATNLVESRRQDAEPRDRICLIHYNLKTRDRAKDLERLLRHADGGCIAELSMGDDRSTGKALRKASAAIVLVAQDEPWRGLGPLRKLFSDRKWLVIRLPGDPRANVPTPLADVETRDWLLGQERELAGWILDQLPWEQPRGSTSENELFEKITRETFLRVPAGEFQMGTDDVLFTPEEIEVIKENGWEWWLEAARPPYQARISELWLARTPVTNRQYGLFLAEADEDMEPSEWRNGRFNEPDQPVVGVSWQQANAYCEWLSSKSEEGWLFSLPTEAQWEYAAQGPQNRRFPWGNTPEPNDEHACFGQELESGRPMAVGNHPAGAGPFGHLDLAGTVWEWCADFWDPSYEGREDGCLDPIGSQDESLRPLRGGSWGDSASVSRSAFRDWVRHGFRGNSIGFRVSCAPSKS